MNTTEDKIRIKQLEISVEDNPEHRQNLQKQLMKLQFRREIEIIQKKIEQLN
jgi:hypothetical protein